jgi:hypothetical protein
VVDQYFSRLTTEESGHVFVFTLDRAEVNSQRMYRRFPGPHGLNVDFPSRRYRANRFRSETYDPDIL